jgi:hypothetical protein
VQPWDWTEVSHGRLTHLLERSTATVPHRSLSVGSMVGNASTARIARDPKLKFERWMNGGDPGSYGIDLSPRIQCARDGKTAHPLRLFA